ncbi:MAG: CHAD domain-containing protein [Ignavibacteria bacterium]|nr:CHAD domain-containing protein [Ignavibacteria bacterium]
MAKARKITGLNPNAPVKGSAAKILRARFEEMTIHEQGTIDGSDIEALHDMRVASRRVQAALKIFRSLFPKKKYKAEYEEVRGLIRSLGEVRDYDVFIEKLENMKKQSSQNASSNTNDNRAINLLIVRKKAEREQKRKLLIQNITSLNKKGYKEHFMSFVSTNLEQTEVSNPGPVSTVSTAGEAS